MHYAIFLLIVVNIWGCNSASDNKTVLKDQSIEAKTPACNQNYDTSLIRYANEFTAKTIDLNSSLSADLKSFLLSVDSNCLKKQTEYKYFITLILEKLALHHLKCCNQHYDLY